MNMLFFSIIFDFVFFFAFAGFIFIFIYRVIKTGEAFRKNYNQNRRPTINVGNKYNTINSHYSDATLNGTGNRAAGQVKNGGNVNHQHAYEHKVEPVDEASVMDMHEERKEAYLEKKRQMKEDLPKSSYSEAQNRVLNTNGGAYRDVNREYGRNGDNGTVPSPYETAVKCPYCSAVNLVPSSRNKKYSCYFCRQEI